MTQPTNTWSYQETTVPVRRRRRTVVVAAVVLALTAGLVAWLAWPAQRADEDRAETPVIKELLNDKPPTMILNALNYRTLYPPGYVDYDWSKRESKPADYDRDREYESTSAPPDCEGNPLFDAEFDLFLGRFADDAYEYPIHLWMFPVDDPGGNADDARGFSVSIFPAPNPASLSEFKEWFDRCRGATITTTVTKFGQVVDRTTRTQELGYTDAPASVADDSLALTREGRELCHFYGLTRGMIVSVECPPTQADAGAQLFRTVVQRIRDI
ncbi:Uncharacterised protein [Mycolicibacterium phlei]|uniref:hypothetical protein n=1 Tax=Mycolicibacterium phlei TaxID=1771 RepID=UPI00078B5C0E|nr:hypothetical protein [Mycolicibacterium phlei]AMO63630.1 hypothetical protein MPHLCCUG_04845 [Mycolicibacterium phlei]STZ22087.1 Uncharacterised protein [Mycolicibacterium phlei]VEG11724.1 Uncharacterised protein [Mycobacteroides chelonae]